jgi:hypothetical protein
LLCPFRVARVSRLIGKSDITANERGWQAETQRLPGKRRSIHSSEPLAKLLGNRHYGFRCPFGAMAYSEAPRA